MKLLGSIKVGPRPRDPGTLGPQDPGTLGPLKVGPQDLVGGTPGPLGWDSGTPWVGPRDPLGGTPGPLKGKPTDNRQTCPLTNITDPRYRIFEFEIRKSKSIEYMMRIVILKLQIIILFLLLLFLLFLLLLRAVAFV